MQEINDEYIENTTSFDSKYNTILRNSDLSEIRNKFELLFKTVTYYTNENIQSPKLYVKPEIIKYSTCICSCNKCKDIYRIGCEGTNITLGVGSLCVKKFNNPKLNAEMYNLTKAKRCEECKISLVFKENEYFQVNAKKGDCLCNECKYKKIILNVPYSEKDYAKYKGAMWDIILKKWYIYRNNSNYHYLISKFK